MIQDSEYDPALADEYVSLVYSNDRPKKGAYVQKMDPQYQDQEEETTPPDSTNLQLEVEGDFFTAAMDGHGGLGEPVYERVIPKKYLDSDDNNGDSFMASIIRNYALEGKNEDGSPNGKFYMDKAQTELAAKEVLKTHKKIDAKELEDYMKQYFARTWTHFDINKDDKLDADTMPMFMRFLASD